MKSLSILFASFLLLALRGPSRAEEPENAKSDADAAFQEAAGKTSLTLPDAVLHPPTLSADEALRIAQMRMEQARRGGGKIRPGDDVGDGAFESAVNEYIQKKDGKLNRADYKLILHKTEEFMVNDPLANAISRKASETDSFFWAYGGFFAALLATGGVELLDSLAGIHGEAALITIAGAFFGILGFIVLAAPRLIARRRVNKDRKLRRKSLARLERAFAKEFEARNPGESWGPYEYEG